MSLTLANTTGITPSLSKGQKRALIQSRRFRCNISEINALIKMKKGFKKTVFLKTSSIFEMNGVYVQSTTEPPRFKVAKQDN